MTALMVVSTGEVVQPMTAEEASSISTRISVKLDAIADNYESAMPLIREAITRRAHLALGYKSPGAYVADRFGKALQRLGSDTRRQVVRELTDAGLSTRAIAPVVGASQRTVARDAAGEPHDSPAEDEPVDAEVVDDDTAEDDEPLTQEQCEALDQASAATEPDGRTTDETPAAKQEKSAVVGLDGKSYKQPVRDAKTKRRSDLTATARRLSTDMRRFTARIHKLAEDDRLGRNAEQVTSLLGRDLSECIESCQGLLDALSTQGEG